MPNIDIPVPEKLQKMFELPSCDQLKLPLPKPIKVQLPTGGSLKAFSDISKGIPNDCSLTFSLMLQIAPLLASMECLVKILKFLKPLMDFVKSPLDPTIVAKVVEAGADLVPCFLIPTPANLIPFIRDLLCLILKLLKCFLGGISTILNLMSGLTVQLKSAKESGNAELQKALECAMENAAIAAQVQAQSIEPLGAILDLMSPIMGIAGVQAIQLPAIGSQTDIESLRQTVETVKGVTDTIQEIVDALGGCPA